MNKLLFIFVLILLAVVSGVVYYISDKRVICDHMREADCQSHNVSFSKVVQVVQDKHAGDGRDRPL